MKDVSKIRPRALVRAAADLAIEEEEVRRAWADAATAIRTIKTALELLEDTNRLSASDNLAFDLVTGLDHELDSLARRRLCRIVSDVDQLQEQLLNFEIAQALSVRNTAS
jgi:hypothetical protein